MNQPASCVCRVAEPGEIWQTRACRGDLASARVLRRAARAVCALQPVASLNVTDVTDAGDSPVDADEPARPTPPRIELERIGRDLLGVEAALRRLDDGTYWTDEVTGDPLADELLLADPVARRTA